MTNYREILRLRSLGINNTKIAESMAISRQTVVTVVSRATTQGLDWQTAEGLSDRELSAKLFPNGACSQIYLKPDFDYIHKEMAKPGMTRELLWTEYCDKCRAAGQVPYQLTQFKKLYRDYISVTRATMHINRKPGEIMEVDWAGQTAHVISTDTGELMDAYVFVSVLPYSGYAYAEAFWDMKESAWLTAHINAYSYYGAVSRILVPDNLRTGIIKHTKEEIIINRSYQELAEHYGTAIIPTRVRKPKDKATVEGTVGVIETYILAAIRNQQFFSLRELNEVIRERLHQFNHKPFQKKDGSRATWFADERQSMLPLPRNPYEISEWKTAKVAFNYHISIDDHYYSVPYEYIGKDVDVRLTRNTVEIFLNGTRVCSHVRIYGRDQQYGTKPEHMPPNHKQYLQWNGERFRKWAEKIGQNTVIVVEAILSSHKVEQQGYRACMGLLKLAETYTPERLEAACVKALSYTPRPNYKSVQTILKSGQDKTKCDASTADTPSSFGFTRGADYYTGGKK